MARQTYFGLNFFDLSMTVSASPRLDGDSGRPPNYLVDGSRHLYHDLPFSGAFNAEVQDGWKLQEQQEQQKHWS
jgi:hypothetical protein